MLATLICKKFTPLKTATKESTAKKLPDNYMDRYSRDEEKLKEWIDEGISLDVLERFQVRYDGFSDRIVYPIRDISGNIRNVGGRTLDPLWKEKELRKYCYFFSWGILDTIYGLSENREHIEKKGEIIIFEGCKSVLLANTWGIRNTGAILTSYLNPHQMKILARLGCRVVFALDKDVEIRKDHNINILKQYVNVEYIYDKESLLDSKDAPVDKGFETYLNLYNKRLCYK